MSSPEGPRWRRSAVPLLVGGLLGFIAGYFAAGGGRPEIAASSPAVPGEESDRVASLAKALERDRDNPALWTALGNAQYDRGNWPEAIDAYENARRREPKDPNLLSDLGAAYRNAGEFGRAVHFFEKARENGPDHWQSLLNLTLVYAYDLGDAEKAQRHLDELKRRYPEVPQLDRLQEKISELRAAA
ncbi:MAG: tetratricopeptide repeat protein [Thermoanaerobaculia bacterium]